MEAAQEPDWVTEEKRMFAEERDKWGTVEWGGHSGACRDGDGYMSEEEVSTWIVPQDFDHSRAEAK